MKNNASLLNVNRHVLRAVKLENTRFQDLRWNTLCQVLFETKHIIKEEIKHLKQENPKMHKCPFLIDKMCVLYKYRGIVCRTHGLAWYDEQENRIRLPYCVNKGLNYSKVFDRETGEVFLEHPIKERLRIDTILTSSEAQKYELEYGEIRPLLKWF